MTSVKRPFLAFPVWSVHGAFDRADDWTIGLWYAMMDVSARLARVGAIWSLLSSPLSDHTIADLATPHHLSSCLVAVVLHDTDHNIRVTIVFERVVDCDVSIPLHEQHMRVLLLESICSSNLTL